MSKKDLLDYGFALKKVLESKRKKLDVMYNELLSLYWLRPESALFRFKEAEILKDLRYLKYPMLDLGCGDGLFTSILFGARVNKKYDAFESIDFSQTDVYNSYSKLPRDFFDKKPSKIGFGLDVKENAVLRARGLKVYDEVRVGNVKEIPFKDKLMNSVFSNMIDDIEKKDLKTVFREVNRVLKPKGYFVFTVPTDAFSKSLVFHNKLSRGRSKWKSYPLLFWNKILKETSFKMVKHIEYGSSDLIKFWDTGFRPFFYYLIGLRDIPVIKDIFIEMTREYYLRFLGKGNAFSIIIAKKK